KMDVEGHETEALDGAKEMLARAQPMIVFENWLHAANPALTYAPLRWLEKHSYKLLLPLFVKHASGERTLHTSWSPDSPGSDEAKITLMPLDESQRFLYPAQVNLLACHQEKLPQLEALFSKS